jgi:hypothetical protein
MFNKRGQFFLLAAVILSVVLVSLSTTVNYANTNKEPDKFYDLSYEIKQEGGEVINYGVYSSQDINGVVQTYTNNVSQYIADMDPDTEIYFIYGNSSSVIVDNYAKTGVNGGLGCAERINSTTMLNLGGTSVSSGLKPVSVGDSGLSCIQTVNLSGNSNKLNLKISNQTYNFALTSDQQFLIITKKKVGNETYIDSQ